MNRDAVLRALDQAPDASDDDINRALSQRRHLWRSRVTSADPARRDAAAAALAQLDDIERVVADWAPSTPAWPAPAPRRQWSPPVGVPAASPPGFSRPSKKQSAPRVDLQQLDVPEGRPHARVADWGLEDRWPRGSRAAFWRRALAAIIDALLVVGLVLAGRLVGGQRFVGPLEFVAVAAFLVVPEGRWGQTPGKYLLRIRVVDATTGDCIGYARSMMRAMARVISVSLFGLGYLVAVWDRDKQTVHDKVADSVVIPRDGRVALEHPFPPG